MSLTYRTILANYKNLNFLRFDNLWLFLPFLILVLYIPQAVYGVYFFRDAQSKITLEILLWGFISYIAFSTVILNQLKLRAKNSQKYLINLDFLTGLVFFLYFVVVMYAMGTATKIAIFESFSPGVTAENIAFAREELFKNRQGFEKILLYLNSLFTTALVPFFLAIIYVERKWYRHILLVMFGLSLLISMEKVLILKALMPLFFLMLHGNLGRKYSLFILLAGIIIVGGIFGLSKFGTEADLLAQDKLNISSLEAKRDSLHESIEQNSMYLNKAKEGLRRLSKNDVVEDSFIKKSYQYQINLYVQKNTDLKITEASINKEIDYWRWAEQYHSKYFLFGFGRFSYVFNRIFWIPYVTAYDWVLFFQERLNAKYLLGKTSSTISYISHQTRFNMEQEVFRFQFGTTGPKTAAANANFWVDGYINFGWFGVIGYSLITAAITMYVIWLSNPALSACFYYFIFQISMGSLTGVLFSNGLILLLALAYFFPIKRREINS